MNNPTFTKRPAISRTLISDNTLRNAHVLAKLANEQANQAPAVPLQWLTGPPTPGTLLKQSRTGYWRVMKRAYGQDYRSVCLEQCDRVGIATGVWKSVGVQTVVSPEYMAVVVPRRSLKERLDRWLCGGSVYMGHDGPMRSATNREALGFIGAALLVVTVVLGLVFAVKWGVLWLK